MKILNLNILLRTQQRLQSEFSFFSWLCTFVQSILIVRTDIKGLQERIVKARMLLSHATLEFMKQGFIFGDFFGFLPFKWNSEREKPELDLSSKSVLGCVLSFIVAVLASLIVVVRSLRSLGRGKGSSSQYDEVWDDYFHIGVIIIEFVFIQIPICTALAYREIPRTFLQIQYLARHFTG